MIKIAKGQQPNSLLQYKQVQGAIYDGPNFTGVKDDIRLSLLTEQGYLCAYCMQRISEKSMKVEHFQCQHSYPNLQLEYTNLLGCCKGNEGFGKKQQICDTRKGSSSLTYSPAIHANFIQRNIKFNSNGKISANDVVYDNEINAVLNLNLKQLKDARASAWDAIEEQLNKKPGTRTRAEIQKLITRYESLNNKGKYLEYAGLILFYLRKKLLRTN